MRAENGHIKLNYDSKNREDVKKTDSYKSLQYVSCHKKHHTMSTSSCKRRPVVDVQYSVVDLGMNVL